MPTCPTCGREQTASAELCEACGARLVPRRRYRGYLLSILLLALIVAVALLSHLLFQSHFVRPPSDFLPTSTLLAVGADLRPDGPAVSHLRHTWSESDADRLAERAIDAAQEFVYWTGLQLDLREDASTWFGREIVAAALGNADGTAGRLPTFVLVARVTNMRRARASLDRSVRPLAREAGWTRSVIRQHGRSIIVWGKPSEEAALAYALHEGCLLIASNDTVIDRCLTAARDPSERLTSTEQFAAACEPVLADSLVWCYGSVPQLHQQLYDALPHLRGGWLSLLRYYRRGASGQPALRTATSGPRQLGTGVFAAALIPESDGIRLRAGYHRGEPREAAPPAEWALLAELLPRETVAYAFLHEPFRWLALLDFLTLPRLPQRGLPLPAVPARTLLELALGWLGLKELPPDALLALIPGDPDKPRPALVVAIPHPQPQDAPPPRPSRLTLPIAKEQLGDRLVVATDRTALEQCRRAARDPDHRLSLDLEPGARLQAWADPARILPAVPGVGELRIEVRDNLQGAEGELLLRIEPRVLLGGD
jgi:hypothetical protein